MGEMPSQDLCRRALLHAAANGAALAAAAPAMAVVEGFTPMSQLKGKDYGKARMRYLACTCDERQLHCIKLPASRNWSGHCLPLL